MQEYKSIDDYINKFPDDVKCKLIEIKNLIIDVAPEAEEAIKYGIPTYTLNGNLVHFAGYKSHIGFYPAPSGIDHFKNDLTAYKVSKGAVQFPLDKPLPLDLIKQIVKFRVSENLSKINTTK